MEDDPFYEALVDSFLIEARDICQRAAGNMLELERPDADPDARDQHYDELARGLHTLKGNAQTFGFPQLGELAHRMEDLVARFREPRAPIPTDAADLLLRASDVFMARLATRLNDDDDGVAELCRSLGDAAERAPSSAGAARPASAPGLVPAPAQVEASDEQAIEDWRIRPRNVEMLMREVDRVRELQLRLDEQRREVESVLHGLDRGRSPDPGATRALLRSVSRGLGSSGEEASDIVEGFEQELKAIATLPLYVVLEPLQRSVRELSRSLGKQARISVGGGEVSLDRRLLNALRGPLLHLVRNAVDHGIEPPEDRAAAGKHAEGSITIRVERAGNTVTIEVEDDGRGLDDAALRATAIARGLLAEEEAFAMSDRELHQLVFRAGFSTRTEVMATSGRGVGLDVVRAAVQTSGGHVEVHTSPGSGTRFRLSLPVMLGATAVMVVRVDELTVGIPMMAIEKIRAATDDHVRRDGTSARFEYEGQLLPLVDLGAALGIRLPGHGRKGQPILVIIHRGHQVAIAIDELVGDRELVVRPLPAELHDLPAYIGAAVQARGDLLLVVEPEFLMMMRTAEVRSGQTARRALVVDDSLAARALHRTILESGGFQVHAVGSARHALDHLRHAFYDLVVADVMMPDIDGLELTRILRAQRETRNIPLVLVSAHDGQPERAEGLAAGADAFVSKKDCVSGRLLDEVAAVISRRERAR